MMRVSLKFAYDGNGYYGFARQPNLKTIEGDIIKKLIEKNYIKNPKESTFRFIRCETTEEKRQREFMMGL